MTSIAHDTEHALISEQEAAGSLDKMSSCLHTCRMVLISSRVRYVLPGSDMECPWYLRAAAPPAHGGIKGEQAQHEN
jgi:hypothetical protein